MLRRKFPSIKPEWLINPKTGRRLEIDCYCKERRLGVEIDGEQHHRYIPYFHKKGYGEFEAMQERDMMKNVLIKKRGIHLIRLPYTVPDNEIEMFLMKKLNEVM
jgi:very-short-patch-repair endonuclease